MNLFLDYQIRFLYILKKLQKKREIHLPKKLTNFTVELPPKGHEANMSYNAAMMLAGVNKKSPLELVCAPCPSLEPYTQYPSYSSPLP